MIEITLKIICYGAVVGFGLSLVLWKHLPAKGRVLLPFVVVSGATSMAIDVMGAGVLWEECCKLTAELLMACILLLTIGSDENSSQTKGIN